MNWSTAVSDGAHNDITKWRVLNFGMQNILRSGGGTVRCTSIHNGEPGEMVNKLQHDRRQRECWLRHFWSHPLFIRGCCRDLVKTYH